MSGALSGLVKCLSPSKNAQPWTLGSGDYPPLLEEHQFMLCPPALQQLWYVEKEFVNNGEIIVTKNSANQFKFINNLDEEPGYYTFWNCGIPSKTKPGVVLVPQKQTNTIQTNIPELPANGSSEISENSNTIETKFQEVISYTHDTIQNYMKLLENQLELLRQDENQATVENYVLRVAEFVSSMLGGKGDEYEIGNLWEWHCQLTQERKQSVVLDISELKFGTSFHRGTLFVILWHSLGMEATVTLGLPKESGECAYPRARLLVQSEKQDCDGNMQIVNLEVDLMSDPGKVEEVQNPMCLQTKTLFNPSKDGNPDVLTKDQSPFNKSFKNTVKKLIAWGRAISKRFKSDGPCMDFIIEVEDTIEEEKLPRLSTQVYKLQKIKQSDVQLGEVLGQGGFGVVRRGKFFGAKVAVKFLLHTANKETDHEIREQLKNELFMLGWLTHPSIVSLTGVLVPQDESSNEYGIVMEFLEKGSLYDIVHSGKYQLPLYQRLHIVLNACQAVYFLHSVEVEHRDISSRNILVDRSYRGKLTDFGLSKTREQIETADNNNKVYQPGNVVYMPYEVLSDENMSNINGKAVDTFSIGVVLWETATRQIPWDGVTTAAIYVKVGYYKQKLELTEQTVPNEKLRNLIADCWQEDPSQRPEFDKICNTLGDIVNDLFQEFKASRESVRF